LTVVALAQRLESRRVERVVIAVGVVYVDDERVVAVTVRNLDLPDHGLPFTGATNSKGKAQTR
jgi:hypothetical protein